MKKVNIQDGEHRKCSCCGRILPLDSFHRHHNEKYGRTYVCRECVREKTRERKDSTRKIESIESLPNEEWRDAVGFEGLYMVSNAGRVMSVYRETSCKGETTKRVFPRIIKQINNRGYRNVKLRKQGKTYTKSVHSLVCEAFLPNPSGATEINHKNGIRHDNRVENLEWCSRQYNIWHSYYVTKRKPSGCKPVMCFENGITYPSCMAAGRDLGLNNADIGAVAHGVYKQIKGYHFKFVEQ